MNTSDNIVQSIVVESASHRENIAVVEGQQSLTYDQLLQRVKRLATALKEAGIAPLDRVAFLCPDSIDYILLSLAILSLDAAIVPISPSLMLDECTDLIEHIDVHHLLCGENIMKDALPSVPFESDELTRAFSLSTRQSQHSNPPEYTSIRPAFIRFSSGTTGASKGVVLSHRAILDRTEAANEGLQITSQDVIGWVLSMSFHFVVTILLFLRKGATVVLCGDPLPTALMDALQTHSITFLYASPIHYRLLAESTSTTREQLASVRLAISTAIQLPEAIAQRFYERFGIRLTEAYGIIEVGLPFIHTPQGGGHDGSLGAPLPSYQVKLTDAGEVLIRGKGMYDAYYSPWELREGPHADGWFHTGDLGTLNEDGALTLIGRRKAVINFSGMKIFPREVEAVLNQFPDIEESMVYGEPHAEYGQLPCAKLVLTDSTSSFDEGALRAFCRSHLTGHKIPKTFHCVPSLPKTASGKIRRS